MSLLLRDPFDDFFFGWEPFLAPVLRSEDQVASKRAASSSMKPYTPILSADLVENESAYQVHVDLPGVNKADLDVSFHEGIMTIRAERKEVQDSETDKVRKIERSYGKVQRSIRLPKNVNPARAEASLKDGVLLVSIPKSDEALQVHKLTIQ